MEREGKPTKSCKEDDLCQLQNERSQAGLQLQDTRSHPAKQPVLLEQLPRAEGSDGPASPSQRPPDTRTTSSTAGLAVAGVAGQWSTQTALHGPLNLGDPSHAQILPAWIPASQCYRLKQHLPQDDQPALLGSCPGQPALHRLDRAVSLLSNSIHLRTQSPKPQDTSLLLMAARCRLHEPFVSAPLRKPFQKKESKLLITN